MKYFLQTLIYVLLLARIDCWPYPNWPDLNQRELTGIDSMLTRLIKPAPWRIRLRCNMNTKVGPILTLLVPDLYDQFATSSSMYGENFAISNMCLKTWTRLIWSVLIRMCLKSFFLVFWDFKGKSFFVRLLYYNKNLKEKYEAKKKLLVSQILHYLGKKKKFNFILKNN